MRTTDTIDNSADIIDSRNVIARIEALAGERETVAETLAEAREAFDTIDSETATPEQLALSLQACEAARLVVEEWANSEEAAELKALEALAEDAEGYCPDWRYGAALIRETHFEDYAREFAEDIHGKELAAASWPFSCIDWERAARELQMDYTSVEFDGVTYLVRS